MQAVVLAERTAASGQYFPEVQKFCLMDLGFSIIPVPSQREAASILAQMVSLSPLILTRSLSLYLAQSLPEIFWKDLPRIIFFLQKVFAPVYWSLTKCCLLNILRTHCRTNIKSKKKKSPLSQCKSSWVKSPCMMIYDVDANI